MDFLGSVPGPTRPAPAGNHDGQDGEEDDDDEEAAEEDSTTDDDTLDAAQSPPQSWTSSHQQSVAAAQASDVQHTGLPPMRPVMHEAPEVPPPRGGGRGGAPQGVSGGGGRASAAATAAVQVARQGSPGSPGSDSEEEDDDTEAEDEDESEEESSSPTTSSPVGERGHLRTHAVSGATPGLPEQTPTFSIQRGGGVQAGDREQLGLGAAQGSAPATAGSMPGTTPTATASRVAEAPLHPLESSHAGAGFLETAASLEMASEQASSDTTTASADESQTSSTQASGREQVPRPPPLPPRDVADRLPTREDAATRLLGHPPEPRATAPSGQQTITPTSIEAQAAPVQASSVPAVDETMPEEPASVMSWLLGAPSEPAVPPKAKAYGQHEAKRYAEGSCPVGEGRIPSPTGDYATVWMKASCPSTSEQLVEESAGTYEVDASMTSRHNLRSLPSTLAPIVGMLLGGDVVDVVEVLSLPDEEGKMVEKRHLPAQRRPTFVRWGRLARLGPRPRAEGEGLYTMISDGFDNVYLKCLKRIRPAHGPDDHSVTSERAAASHAASSMQSVAQSTTETRRLHLSVAQVLGDPAAERSMVKELYQHQVICAALGRKADRELHEAQELDNKVAELKKLNETRRKIAPQLVEQRQESFRRWGAWQTEVFDLNAARLRTLQNMQTQVQNAEREMEQRFQQTRGARHMAAIEATMDVELSQSLAAMEAQTARCYLKLVGSPSDSHG